MEGTDGADAKEAFNSQKAIICPESHNLFPLSHQDLNITSWNNGCGPVKPLLGIRSHHLEVIGHDQMDDNLFDGI